MTTEQFRDYWRNNYANSNPFGHELRTTFMDRWFRIHSLPLSKRYADNENEYKIILDRQNKLISDIFGGNTEFLLLISVGINDFTYKNYEYLDFINKFQKVDGIGSCETEPEEHEMHYDTYVKSEIWRNHSFDITLKKIADDEIRAIFINPKAGCVIAPYDGGIDIIMKNTNTRNVYKSRYTDWLSERIDGL